MAPAGRDPNRRIQKEGIREGLVEERVSEYFLHSFSGLSPIDIPVNKTVMVSAPPKLSPVWEW